MKRLFKFLVAAATSLSLLIANVPLTQFMVRADDTPAAPTYTLTSDFVERQEGTVDTLQFISGETKLTEPSNTVFTAGTINIALNQNEGAVYKSFRIITMEDNQQKVLFESAENGSSYTINSDFKIINLVSAEDESGLVGIMDIIFVNNGQGGQGGDNNGEDETEYTVTIKSAVLRKLFFRGCALDEEGERWGDPGITVSQGQEYTLKFLGMPEELTIENPGDTGVEELGRLVKVVINGQERPVTARYDRCSYSLKDLEPGDITIELDGDNKPGGVIEWTNSGCPEDQIQGNIKRNHEQFENGSARVVGVYEFYEDIAAGKNIMSDYGIEETGALFDEYNGCLRIENGYWIAFEFTPLPGYQLVEFGGSAPGQAGINISTNEAPNVYYFQMPQGNCHFTARFDTPENIVKINGNSIVDDGAVAVAENEFAGGTAQMTVGDLSSDTQAAYNQNRDFTEALEENDLEVQEYLSLDLANIYQKANTDEYWEEEYHELEKGNAEVTLKVAGNFNPGNNKVYIVHDLGDGEGVETIEAVYNPNTHEITFETGSFSNFMIATSDEQNDIAVDPNNNNDDYEDDEYDEEYDEDFTPHFSIALDENDEPALGVWEEGQDKPFFVPMELGLAIPGDSVIHNDLPKDLPDECLLIYYINGEEVDCFNMEERDLTFSPGHFVVLDGVYASEGAFMVFFTECYVVGIDVIQMDLSLKALDKDGKVIEPVGGSDKDGTLIFECGDAGEEDFTYFEIAYPVCPAEVVVKGINDYAIFYLECNEKDMFNTPIGENSIEYPSEDDYIWIGAWGMVPDSETVNFTDSLTKVSAVFEGVSEDKIDDYLLLVTEFDTSDASEEEIAAFKKQIAEKGYDISEFPLGFDITLYDKNGEVHEPGFTVRITLVLEKALDLEDGETVLILHKLDDDKFEIIEAVYNAKDLTLTFETKSFSPFVVAFGTKAAPASVVKTGEDIATTRIVIASLLIGAAAAAGILFIRRRESEIEKEEN